MEAFLKSVGIMRSLVLACGIVLVALAELPHAAQQAKPPRPGGSAPPVSGPSSIWRSETTGKEYRVWIDEKRLYAEWVNIPAVAARNQGYIRTECRRVGAKWIGTSRIFLPCTVGEGAKERIANRCHLTMRMEIDSVTPKRIAGRVEDPKKFDCQTCKVPETVWKSFVWIPKKQSAGRRP